MSFRDTSKRAYVRNSLNFARLEITLRVKTRSEKKERKILSFSNKVTALCYASAERQLLSGGEDGVIVCWNMATNRKETAAWVESDVCQVCPKGPLNIARMPLRGIWIVLKLRKSPGLRKTLFLEHKSYDGSATVGIEAASLSLLRSRLVRSLHVATDTDTSDGLRVRSESLRSVSHTA